KNPGHNVPGDGAKKTGKDDLRIDSLDIDHARSDGFCNTDTKSKCGHEIEERSPENRLTRRKHARRDDGSNRVGRVMKTVQEIEHKRGEDQSKNDEKCRRCEIHAKVSILWG